MIVEVLEHDEVTTKARIKFTHNDVVHEEDYDLSLVVPGTTKVFSDLKIEFTKEHQLKVIDILTKWVQKNIESGLITNGIDNG